MKRIAQYIVLCTLSLCTFSCRPQSDDLLSYGQNDAQAFAAAEQSFVGEFTVFWLAMNENYCIWDFEEEFGLNWDDVYDTYMPQFKALDERQTLVTDDELTNLYKQFIDSLHDGHSAFLIKNLHTGRYVVFNPNLDRNLRERPDVYAAEDVITTLDLYRTSTVDSRYRVHDYGSTGSQDIIVEIIDSTANRLLVATAAYIQAVDDAGGPDAFNDSVYSAVKRLNTNAKMLLGYIAQPDVVNTELDQLVNVYNNLSLRYGIVAQQIGVTLPTIDATLSTDGLKFIRFALFEGNIAYLRLGGFALSDYLPDEELSSDTTSMFYTYQLAVRKVWHQWFDTIQVLHANGQLGGVIIDVRNNGGGYTDDYQYVLGALLPSGGFESHTLRVKNGTGRLDFAPLTPFIMKTYPDEHAVISQEPIVVLANSHSVSLSENTTWGVKNQPNGHAIGTRTFGGLSALATNPKYYSQSYSGAFGVENETAVYGYVPKFVCLYPHKDGRLRPVEGFGFEPDEAVPFNRNLWDSQGRDNQLEKALDYIQK